ncbi:hypothetical protein Vafri_9965 [Volvox africanus]|uniref:Reverse transcriptase RNase H-like domain-containing protein n=1 Tax=Volvox africanus TaxID=51714 RepID=A0A8J4B5C0_9CHLO|nr:hypothetical protein Vafri_9965 [Volvox africanus]
MLAAVWAVKMFRHHLIGGPPFKLVTDHQPLTYLMSTEGLTYLMSTEGLTGQYARFALAMQEYNFIIEHRPGQCHQNADTLSRNPRDSKEDCSPRNGRAPRKPGRQHSTLGRQRLVQGRNPLSVHTHTCTLTAIQSYTGDI